MKKQKTMIYGILLSALVAVALAGSLCMQESQARYVSVAGWHTQVYDPVNTVTSSLLIKGGQTVLIGKVPAEEAYQLPVWFAAEGGNITGNLVCEAVENGEYITVDFPKDITLVQGVPQNFTLTLEPTVLAKDPRTENVPVKLRMYWAEDPALEAVLQLELLPVGYREEESQPDGQLRDLSEYVTIMEKYAPGSLLSMTCNIPAECTAWRLGMLDENSLDMPFPALTRYSLDSGKSYRMLPKAGWIDLPLQTDAPVTVWFDFSYVETDKTVFGGLLSITVSGEAAGQWHGKNIFSVDAELSLPTSSADGSVVVVTQDTPLEILIPADWANTQLEYTLTRQGKHSDAPLPAVTIQEGKIIVSAEDGLPKPGTYILTLMWMAGDLQVAQRQIVLFVNYSAYADCVNTLQQAAPTTTEGGDPA